MIFVVAQSEDFLKVASLLTDEERALSAVVRSFVQRILPGIAGWFEDGYLPMELALELGKLGLLRMHLPGYGCGGATNTAYGIACHELEAGDSGIRSFMSVQGLAMYAIHHWGSEEQKHEWLPKMATGEAIGCFGLTEPDVGSDAGAIRTHARRHGADWILYGQKMWVTNGSVADVAIVWARTDDGMRGVVVPTESEGFLSASDQRETLVASIHYI